MPIFPSLSVWRSCGSAGASAAQPLPHQGSLSAGAQGKKDFFFPQQLSKGDGGRVADPSAAGLGLLLADEVPD